MKKLIILLALLLIPNQSFAQDVDKFVGKWTSEGAVFLIISQEEGIIKLEFPENSTWRAEFQNIRIEEGVLKFEQINYIVEDGGFKEKFGMDHPFSGVVNFTEMWEDAEGKMQYKVWVEELKDEAPVITTVTKLKE